MTRHADTCEQEDAIQDMRRELGDLNRAVFRGDGSTPSLKEQMAVITSTVKGLCWLVGVTCVAVIGQIVVLVFRVIGHI